MHIGRIVALVGAAMFFCALHAQSQSSEKPTSSFCKEVLSKTDLGGNWREAKIECLKDPTSRGFEPAPPPPLLVNTLVCNTSEAAKLSFSLATREGANTDIRTQGFFNREPGECVEFPLFQDEELMVAAKLSGHNEHWTDNADTKICVTTTGEAFDIVQRSGSNVCPTNSEYRFAYKVRRGTRQNFAWDAPLPNKNTQSNDDSWVGPALVLGVIAGVIGVAIDETDKMEENDCMRTCKREKSAERCYKMCSQ